MEQQRSDRSLGELFGDLASQITNLVRQEFELAKTEVTQKATQTGKDIGFLAVGGAVAYAGFLVLLATIVIALGQLGLPWWLSALIVGLVVTGVGYFLVQKGLSEIRNRSLAPQQTIDTVKEDVEWAKRQTS